LLLQLSTDQSAFFSALNPTAHGQKSQETKLSVIKQTLKGVPIPNQKCQKVMGLIMKGTIFHLEDRGCMFLQNLGNYLPNCIQGNNNMQSPDKRTSNLTFFFNGLTPICTSFKP
jgi:guanyl-specific ribonuclease Sa